LARRQKNDHRDADLILELLHRGGFPRLHRPPTQSLEVMRQLRYRHRGFPCIGVLRLLMGARPSPL
jgi:hypothetical protein